MSYMLYAVRPLERIRVLPHGLIIGWPDVLDCQARDGVSGVDGAELYALAT